MKYILCFLFAIIFFHVGFCKGKFSNELGLHIAYTPRAVITKTMGSNLSVFKSRGFLSFQPNYTLFYNINKRHSVGLCFTLVSSPWYYYHDITGTSFSSKYPNRSKRSNTQSSNMSFDFGCSYRFYFPISKQSDLFLDVNPNVKVNLNQDLKYGVNLLEKNDTLNVYEVNMDEVSILSGSLRANFGFRKYFKERKYFGLSWFSYFSLQSYKGTYVAMLNEPEQSSGSIKHRNMQVGLKFFVGL